MGNGNDDDNNNNRTMTNPPKAKRARLSFSCNHINASAATDDTRPIVCPDAAVSSSHTTPSAELSSPFNLVFTNDTPPTSDNIESALSVVSDRKKKYTNREILQALKDLVRWAARANDLHREFCNEFLELGGISRILKFLMIPSNMSNMEYVKLDCIIIRGCSYVGQYGEDDDIAQVMAKKFVEKGGIHTLLLSNEEYTGGSNSFKLKAVESIWVALTSMISNKTAFDGIKKDKQLNMLDDALATLRLLNGENNATWRVRHAKFSIVNFFAFLSGLANLNTVLVVEDFEGRNIFRTCLDSMMDSNIHWYYNKTNWAISLTFFFICLRRQLFPSQNNDDLKIVIYFCVAFIKKAPNDAFKAHAFMFLREAGHVIGRAEMAKTPDIMSTLGSILDSNNNVEVATKAAAKKCLRKLL
jgi:hypothetical protein